MESKGGTSLLTLSGFEALAGSRMRRPAEQTRMLNGLSVADVGGGGSGGAGREATPPPTFASRGGWGAVGGRAPPPPPAVEPLDDANDEFCRVCWQGVSESGVDAV